MSKPLQVGKRELRFFREGAGQFATSLQSYEFHAEREQALVKAGHGLVVARRRLHTPDQGGPIWNAEYDRAKVRAQKLIRDIDPFAAGLYLQIGALPLQTFVLDIEAYTGVCTAPIADDQEPYPATLLQHGDILAINDFTDIRAVDRLRGGRKFYIGDAQSGQYAYLADVGQALNADGGSRLIVKLEGK
jgi:hypothetical protein